MYTSGDLSVYPYFNSLLNHDSVSVVLDALTGVVSRPYILEFIHTLIDQGSVFTAAMVDLDNFKSFNDNYGHSVGDKVLTDVADRLIRFVGNRGLVGRYGGDEFLLVLFLGQDYQHIHDFYADMYYQAESSNTDYVFRRDYAVDHLKLFVSATIGSATFPKDAHNYEALFSLVDKTLYRGKFKGRSCYIIYVAEKHAHLEIPKMAKHSLYDTFIEIVRDFDSGTDIRDSLQKAFEPLRRNINIHFLFYVDQEGSVLDAKINRIIGQCENLEPLIKDGYFASSNRDEAGIYPKLQALLDPYDIHSLLILSIDSAQPCSRFLILSPEPNTLHLWQDEELAIGFLITRLIREKLGF